MGDASLCYDHELHHRLLSRDEEYEYLKKAQQGDLNARNKLVLHNQKLVAKIAGHYSWSGLDKADLIQQGMIGLIKAIQKYKMNSKKRLSTYATYWINLEIQRYVYDNCAPVRIPPYIHDGINKVKRILKKEPERNQGREEDIEYLAEQLKCSTGRIRNIFLCNKILTHSVSLNATIWDKDDNKITVEDTLSGPYEDAEEKTIEKYDKNDKKKMVYTLFTSDELTEQEKNVLKLRFGFFGNEKGLTLTQTGNTLGLTMGQVKKIQENAVKKAKTILQESNTTVSDNI